MMPNPTHSVLFPFSYLPEGRQLPAAMLVEIIEPGRAKLRTCQFDILPAQALNSPAKAFLLLVNAGSIWMLIFTNENTRKPLSKYPATGEML
jgi:hypothetical protein